MTEVKPTFHGEDEFHGDNSGMHGRVEGNHTTRIRRVKYHIRVFDATFLTPSEDIRPYGTMMYSCLSVLILPCVVDHAWRNLRSSGAMRMVTNAPSPDAEGGEPEGRPPLDTKQKIALVLCFPIAIASAAFDFAVLFAIRCFKYFSSWYQPFPQNLYAALRSKKEFILVCPKGWGLKWEILKSRSDDGSAVLDLRTVADSRGDGFGIPRCVPDTLSHGDEFEIALGPFESFCLFRRNSAPPPPPNPTSDGVPSGEDSRVYYPRV